MHAIKKSLMQSNFIDINKSNNQEILPLTSNTDNLPMLGISKVKSLILQEKFVFPNKNENDDLNLNSNLNLSDYLFKYQNKDYNSNLSKFTNIFFNKFKKVFLINLKIKNYNFIPTSEINERQKLIN